MRPAEAQLVKQYGVAACVPNVSNKLLLEMSISWTMVQSREPTEAQGLERKIIERLGKHDIPRAKRYFEKYLRVASRDPGKEKYYLHRLNLCKETISMRSISS